MKKKTEVYLKCLYSTQFSRNTNILSLTLTELAFNEFHLHWLIKRLTELSWVLLHITNITCFDISIQLCNVFLPLTSFTDKKVLQADTKVWFTIVHLSNLIAHCSWNSYCSQVDLSNNIEISPFHPHFLLILRDSLQQFPTLSTPKQIQIFLRQCPCPTPRPSITFRFLFFLHHSPGALSYNTYSMGNTFEYL